MPGQGSITSEPCGCLREEGPGRAGLFGKQQMRQWAGQSERESGRRGGRELVGSQIVKGSQAIVNVSMICVCIINNPNLMQ